MRRIFEIPLTLASETNQREHWRRRSERNQVQIEAVKTVAIPCVAMLALGWHVTLIRLAPFPFDDDNLVAAFKHVRDEVSRRMGFKSDRDKRVRWHYGEAFGQGEAILIVLEKRTEIARQVRRLAAKRRSPRRSLKQLSSATYRPGRAS